MIDVLDTFPADFPRLNEVHSRPDSDPLAGDIPRLTQRMAKGNGEAFRIFYAAYHGRLMRYLLVVARGNEDRAREALQATFVRVVRHVRQFPSEQVFWSWLTVLARTALFDQGRTKRRYLAFLDRFNDHDRVVRDPGRDISDEGRLASALKEQLDALPPDERRLIERKYFEHESVRAIAAETNRSEKAIDSLLVRIRRKLKQGVLEALHDEKNP